jgi:hypothetical protein
MTTRRMWRRHGSNILVCLQEKGEIQEISVAEAAHGGIGSIPERWIRMGCRPELTAGPLCWSKFRCLNFINFQPVTMIWAQGSSCKLSYIPWYGHRMVLIRSWDIVYRSWKHNQFCPSCSSSRCTVIWSTIVDWFLNNTLTVDKFHLHLNAC